MALCFGCHQHVGSFPIDHVKLWESRFTKKEKDQIKDLHNFTRDKLVKKRWVATEEKYKLLKMMLMKSIIEYTGGQE
jgi:hypothetical protein